MKLVINTSHQRFGGGVQVAWSFMNECRKYPEHEYHVWVGPAIAALLDERDFPENFHFYRADFGVIRLRTIRRIQRELSRLEARIRPDVIVSTTGPTYFRSQAPQVIGYNLPLYIYPESPYLRDISLYRWVRYRIKKLLHLYFFRRDGAAFLAQTEDVNMRVRKALKTERVFTVSNTYSHVYEDWNKYPPKVRELDVHEPGMHAQAKGDSDPGSASHQPEFRFLTLTAYYLHKNLEILPEVVAELRARGFGHVRFVTTMKQEDFDYYLGSARKGLKDGGIGDAGIVGAGIVNIGPVKPEECPSLYAECDGLFLPTLAECFSAAYPEAMVMEKPIVTTDLGFARSICGDAAVYYEPKVAVSAADAIVRLLTEPGLQETLIENGKRRVKRFDSAADRARKILEVCEQVAYQPEEGK
ncbi:MAG: mannosyltransferase [Bacteroidetes bacterium]|nr:MAG: mannosyltransferase [Bacteroidota bacterium]